MTATYAAWVALAAPLAGLAFTTAIGSSVSQAHGRRRRLRRDPRRLHRILRGARVAAPAQPGSARRGLDRLALGLGRPVPDARLDPGRPALRDHAARRHRRRLPDPRLLGRVHARRSRGTPLLRVPEPLRLLDAPARAGGRLRHPARRLGHGRALVLPADRLLVGAPGRGRGRQEGVHHERDRRHRDRARDLRDLGSRALDRLPDGVRAGGRRGHPDRQPDRQLDRAAVVARRRREVGPAARCRPGSPMRWRARHPSPP